MKKSLRLIALAILLLSPAIYAGHDGNGGDMLSDQDKAYGEGELQESIEETMRIFKSDFKDLHYFAKNYPEAFPNLPAKIKNLEKFFRDLSNAAQTTEIKLTTELLCAPFQGQCKAADALNFPDKKEILFNIQRARSLSPQNLTKLIVHELVGIAGYETSFEYTVTNYILKYFAVVESNEYYFRVHDKALANLMLNSDGSCKVQTLLLKEGENNLVICLDKHAYGQVSIGKKLSLKFTVPNRHTIDPIWPTQDPYSGFVFTRSPLAHKKWYTGPAQLNVFDQNTNQLILSIPFSYIENGYPSKTIKVISSKQFGRCPHEKECVYQSPELVWP